MTRKDIGFLPSALSMASECSFTGGFLNGAGSCLNAGCAGPPPPSPPSNPQRHLVIYTVDCFFVFYFYKKQLELSTRARFVSLVETFPVFFFSFLNDEHENWVRYISGVFIHIYLDLPQSSTVFSLLRSDVMLSGHSLPCYLFSVSFLRLIFALLLFPAHDTSACQPGPWGGLSLPLSPPAKSLPK